MTQAGGSRDSVGPIRRLRGVSWEWRHEAPVKSEDEGREAGVIAQEVQETFPELVKSGPDGYLRVDYGGLAAKLADAVVELSNRLQRVEARGAAEHSLSDAAAKRNLGPVETALERLRAGDELSRGDYTALVGALVEAVKSLDERLTRLERESERDRS